MKRIFAFALAALVCLALAVSATAAGYTLDANGNAVYETAVGYTFGIDDVDGKIDGEDATVLTSAAGLDNCGVWAIWFVAEKVGKNVYEAKTDGAAMGGTKPSVDLKENQIIVVVHSSSSNPNDAATYPNWEDKVAALAVKTGDYLKFENIDIAAGTADNATMTVTTKDAIGEIPVDESSEPAAESSEESVEAAESSEPTAESSESGNTAVSEPASSETVSETISGVVSSEIVQGGGLGSWLWVIIGAAVVLVVIIVVVVLNKKK